MIRWGAVSAYNIGTLHPDLRRVLHATALVIPERFDFKVICGFRNEVDQNEAFRKGTSEKQWPDGKHNTFPSLAFDFLPVRGGWNDHVIFGVVYGYLEAVANRLEVKLRWLGDGNSDGRTLDQKLRDLGHVELA